MSMHKFDFISYIRDFQLIGIQLTNFSPAVYNARVLLDSIGVISPSDCARRHLQRQDRIVPRRQIEAVRYYRDYIDLRRYSSDALRFVH